MWASLCGAGVGAGLLLLGLAALPVRTDLVAGLGRWETQRDRAVGATAVAHDSLRARWGHKLVAALRRRGVNVARHRSDLALTDTTLEDHWTTKFLLGGFGFLLPIVFVGIVTAAGVGVGVGWRVPTFVGPVLGVLFFLLPDLGLAQEANARREDLRRVLSSYLDLVAMQLAGGRGIPEALPAAAAIGQGWAFEQLGETISRARYAGTTPWVALAELGRTVDLPELRDLGAALGLVADDGAKVRQSLAVRSASQRRRRLADLKAAADKTNQSIEIALIGLVVGLLLFLGYPAVSNMLAL